MFMKIKDILNEGVTDVVARFYIEASKGSERFYNPENVKYKEMTAEFYEKNFKPWFKDNIVSVVTEPIDKPQPEYTNAPKPDKLQSPGYRGLQYALHAAGLPYNHNVQKYQVSVQRMLATQTMDGARNNNGQ